MQNPFNSNPLTRNRVLPTVQFAGNDAERKNLKVPEAKFSWQEMQDAYNNLHVPQQETPLDRIGAFNVNIARDGTRIIQAQSPVGEWGDAWGRDEFRKEQALDKRSAEFEKRSKIENAKLSAELEKDEFRKQLLADIESGKMFPTTRLEEVNESKRSSISFKQTQQTEKDNKDGSNSDKQNVH